MKEVVALAHTVQLGTWSGVHILRYARARTHKDGIIAGTEKAVDGDIVLTHHTVGNELHAQRLYLLDFLSHHALRQTILRDAVHQDTAWLSLSLEDGDVESLASQVASHRQARRTRTDDCHTSTCLLRQFLTREFHLGIEVSNKLFQLTYLHRLTLLAEHAMSLALFLVRTNSSADGRQVALGIDDGHRRTHVAHGQLVHEVWNIILDRTSLAALRNLAMQATLGFFYRLQGRETFVDNLEASHWLRLLRCTLLSI